MAFTDSGAGIQADMEGPGSSGSPPGGQGDVPAPGTAPRPQGGPILAALQRQAQGPQVSAPGPGNMADSLGKLKMALDLMESSLNGFPHGSRQKSDIYSALKTLSRHLPEMGAQSGLQQTHFIDLLRRGRQNPVLQALAGLIGGGGQRGPPGPQPPMPSTPLPGV